MQIIESSVKDSALGIDKKSLLSVFWPLGNNFEKYSEIA